MSQAQQRRERRSIPPFGDGAEPNALSNVLDSVLAKCRFAPFENMALAGDDTHFLSQEEARRPIAPQFEILVDRIDELDRRLGLRTEDVEIGLSARSRHLRRYEVLGKWRLGDVPTDVWSPDPTMLSDVQSEREISFVLAARVVARRGELEAQGLAYNKVLCRKVFSVRGAVETFTFPFRWATFGADPRYPEHALWVIERKSPYDDGQFDLPVSELLTVLVNDKAQDSLIATDAARGSNDLAWRMLAADITTQIWADVLCKVEYEPEEDDTESLAGQIFTHIATASGLPYADIRELADEDDHPTELRNLIATVLKVVR